MCGENSAQSGVKVHLSKFKRIAVARCRSSKAAASFGKQEITSKNNKHVICASLDHAGGSHDCDQKPQETVHADDEGEAGKGATLKNSSMQGKQVDELVAPFRHCPSGIVDRGEEV